MRNSLAGVLCELGALYNNTHRNAESEAALQEALSIVRQLAQSNPTAYQSRLSDITNTLGFLYLTLGRYSESEPLLQESLAIREQLANEDPLKYESMLAQILNNISILKGFQQKTDEAFNYEEKSVILYRKIVAPKNNELEAFVGALWRYCMMYANTPQHAKTYELSEELIPLMAKMVEKNLENYKVPYVQLLGNQSYICNLMKQYAKGENYAKQALSMDASQHWIYSNLAASLLFQGKYTEAEKIYVQYKSELKESLLDDFNKFAEAGVIPKKYEADVEKIKKMLNEE